MPKLSPLLEHWYAALLEPVGIVVVTTEEARSTVNRLYAARRDAADPALEALSLTISPTDPSQIWIIKKEPDLASPPRE